MSAPAERSSGRGTTISFWVLVAEGQPMSSSASRSATALSACFRKCEYTS